MTSARGPALSALQFQTPRGPEELAIQPAERPTYRQTCFPSFAPPPPLPGRCLPTSTPPPDQRPPALLWMPSALGTGTLSIAPAPRAAPTWQSHPPPAPAPAPWFLPQELLRRQINSIQILAPLLGSFVSVDESALLLKPQFPRL